MLQLAHRYALGSLTYAREIGGRGLLVFKAGDGVLALSGVDADQTAATTYVLHLDLMQVFSLRAIHGDCILRLSAAGDVYRSLTCRGRIVATGETFSLRWRGLDRPAQLVR